MAAHIAAPSLHAERVSQEVMVEVVQEKALEAGDLEAGEEEVPPEYFTHHPTRRLHSVSQAFRISGKSGRSYEAGLLYGDGSYFRHPYGNRPNFLLELLQDHPPQDMAKPPATPPGKFAVWLVFCFFMVAMAGIIIFLSEASNSSSSSSVQVNTTLSD